MAQVGREAANDIEAMRWEFMRRSLELERRALLWRLVAGVVGFALGLLAGGLSF